MRKIKMNPVVKAASMIAVASLNKGGLAITLEQFVEHMELRQNGSGQDVRFTHDGTEEGEKLALTLAKAFALGKAVLDTFNANR